MPKPIIRVKLCGAWELHRHFRSKLSPLSISEKNFENPSQFSLMGAGWASSPASVKSILSKKVWKKSD